MAAVKGFRTRHAVTVNHNKALPGEKLYINIPEIKRSSCLVPRSLHLLFNFKVSNTKSYFLHNLSKLLQKNLLIRLAGQKVYENTSENLYEVNKDLWNTNSERQDMVEYGIADENLRKLISKDDSGAKTGSTQKVMH